MSSRTPPGKDWLPLSIRSVSVLLLACRVRGRRGWCVALICRGLSMLMKDPFSPVVLACFDAFPLFCCYFSGFFSAE